MPPNSKKQKSKKANSKQQIVHSTSAQCQLERGAFIFTGAMLELDGSEGAIAVGGADGNSLCPSGGRDCSHGGRG
jgi:hypothetical protein